MRQYPSLAPAKSPIPTKAQRTLPPRWVFALAILLGALGASFSPFGHVHLGRHGAYAHQHSYLGPHSHSRGPDGPPAPASPERDDSTTLNLAAAATLEVFVPAAALVAPPKVQAVGPLPPLPVPRRCSATPASPRGPPSFSC